MHELMSLAMFAQGDYRGAATEANAALVFGPAADWPTLYSYYNNIQTYTSQLESLENYVKANPSSMSARFELAYQDVMMGHRQAAQVILGQVAAKEPQDQVAVGLLKQLETPSGAVGNLAQVAPLVR